ncbi:unnamed protein product [Macrosiphum euphorbiae]|uniref:Major facilitator superfamily (MFS) profile domain-containing protein n=1 Tax=Macrosiphum euphorbiae TaxID=13131 RepID=A0AAV0X804_9HEMI|nr:unnamed protein product [Macrosiphum euphorbiae]
MCLEWTVHDDDVTTENDWSTSENMSKTLIYGGAIISAGPAALIASMQTKLREVLTIGTLFTLCGSIVLMTCSTDALSTLITGRILHGMGAGIVCVIVPNYAAEITEPKYRGENTITTPRITTIFFFCFTLLKSESFYQDSPMVPVIGLLHY